MGRGRARCAGNGVFVEEALVFCGRGIGVFVQFRGRVIGVFVIVALGFSSTFVVAPLVFLCSWHWGLRLLVVAAMYGLKGVRLAALVFIASLVL